MLKYLDYFFNGLCVNIYPVDNLRFAVFVLTGGFFYSVWIVLSG